MPFPPDRDRTLARPPGGTPATSGEADLAKRRGAGARSRATVGDMDGRSFAVTLVKVGSGLPLFEIGAYTYTSDRLPSVGETIVVHPAAGGADLHGYVTRIKPDSDAPISVVEVEDTTSADDFVVRSDEYGAA